MVVMLSADALANLQSSHLLTTTQMADKINDENTSE